MNTYLLLYLAGLLTMMLFYAEVFKAVTGKKRPTLFGWFVLFLSNIIWPLHFMLLGLAVLCFLGLFALLGNVLMIISCGLLYIFGQEKVDEWRKEQEEKNAEKAAQKAALEALKEGTDEHTTEV